MKKTFLLCLLGIPVLGFSQTNANKQITAASQVNVRTKLPADINGPKTLLCNDTLRYVEFKEVLLGTETFYNFSAWQADGESAAQVFVNNTSHTINAIEFYGGRNNSSGAAVPTVNVTAAVYNVDANNNPTTMLGSGTIALTGTTTAYRRVTLSTPVTVTGNYALVLTPTTTNGVLTFLVDDIAINTYDEDYFRYKSNYYDNSAGAWVNTPTLTANDPEFPATLNFEAVISPVVSYTINTDFTASPSPACAGSSVSFTNTSTPMSLLTNRMYTWGEFREYFGLAAADSSFAWSMGNGTPLIWSQNTSYTYANAGSYVDTLYTLGGFWNSCLDIKATPITVNPATNATFTYPSNTVCSGSANVTPTVSSPGTFSAGAGLNFVSTTTGEINLSTSSDGTYTITYTTSGACSATSSQTFTISSAPDASFSYASSSLCSNSNNALPVFPVGAGAGTFSSTAGLVINSATGEINVATSTPGTYTVTNSIAASGSCAAASETFSVTVKTAPTATIGGGGAICAGSGNSVNVTGTLTGAGPWSLVLSTPLGNQPYPSNTNSISVPVPELGAGTYSIVSVTDASGCTSAGTGTATVTVNPVPTANAIANQTVCNGASTSSVLFTSGTPNTTFSWTNNNTSIGLGASGNGSINPFVATNTTASPIVSTVTVTPTASGCTGTASTFTITVNPGPAVTFTAPTTVCVYSSNVTLSASPAGGTFSGTGVSGTTFNPSTAGVGSQTITYTVTESGCTGTGTTNIEVSACLSLDDIVSANGFAVYPNPSNGNVTFTFADGNDVELTIIAADGKVVYQNNFQTTQTNVDLSSLASGSYVVRVVSNGNSKTSQLILE